MANVKENYGEEKNTDLMANKLISSCKVVAY